MHTDKRQQSKYRRRESGKKKTLYYAAWGNPDRKVFRLSKNCRNDDGTAHRQEMTIGIQIV